VGRRHSSTTATVGAGTVTTLVRDTTTVTGDASVGGAETPCVGLALRPPDTHGWPVGERWSEPAHTHDQTEVV